MTSLLAPLKTRGAWYHIFKNKHVHKPYVMHIRSPCSLKRHVVCFLNRDLESVQSVLEWRMDQWPKRELDRELDNSNYTCVSSSNSAGPGVASNAYFRVECERNYYIGISCSGWLMCVYPFK